ncbi:MAG: ABC transporter substrate-binding protein [Blastocatellia bacterium]|nr:MAG: ABC transporter substrate-binding protein [Blastocatellia bacterium]
MSGRRAVSPALFGLVLSILLAPAGVANAAEIKVLCSNGIKAVVEELVPQFEHATKHKVAVQYGLAAVLKQQIESGEPFDVAILTPAVIDDVIKQGKIAANSRTMLARSGLAIAVRAGSQKTDVHSVEAFKRALLDSKSIIYAKEGASGVAFAALIQKMAIADALKSKTTLATTGEAVGESVARGDVQFGILPVSEILPIHGVEVLGAFPEEVQNYIVMVGGVSAASKQANAGADFLKFMTAPAALPVIKAKGMERVQ